MVAQPDDADLLRIEHLTIRFGGLVAVDDVSLVVKDRSITAVIGPNGAGKTTLFNCVTGFYRPDIGACELFHRDGKSWSLEQMPTHDIAARAGVARTFQNVRLFSQMTVLENLLVAQHKRLMRASLFSVAGLLGLPSYHAALRLSVEKAKHYLDLVGLYERADEEAGNLPYGAQRRLEIVRAMCSDPVLLCLDEPAAGLNARESSDLNELLQNIRVESDCAILLIEHDMRVVMTISDFIIVLDHGSKIAEGEPASIRSDRKVIAAYLGEQEEDSHAAAH